MPHKLVDALWLECGIEKDDMDAATVDLNLEEDKEYIELLEGFNARMEAAQK